jgi:hypothetical protein
MNEELTLGMIGIAWTWMAIAAGTVATIVRKGRPLPQTKWGEDRNQAVRKPQDMVLAKYSAAVMVWGIFLTLAVTTLLSILRVFPHTYKFLCAVSFPFCWWAGYFIVRSTRERPLQ